MTVLSTSPPTEASWWIKLAIDITSPFAWHVGQELGHVLNCLSPSDRLATVFKPVSPPPYLNGGPKEFLSWVIEALGDDVSADMVADFLEGRLPRPVDDLTQWKE